jgi:hypothetical protein
MPTQPKAKPWNQFPRDDSLGMASLQCLDWIVTQLNQQIGQAAAPPSPGIGVYGVYGQNIIDPTSGQIVSKGSRTSAIATAIQVVTTTTTATFYWDGSNGSQPFKIYRDDATVFGPFITGSGLIGSGLTARTTYYFYPYYDETLGIIAFANVPGTSVGSPAIAFTLQNNLAAQQQILRNRVPLAFLLTSTGVATPSTGSTNHNGGSGGAGAGVGGNGLYLR